MLTLLLRKGESIKERWDRGEEVNAGEMATLKAGNVLPGCIATPAMIASFVIITGLLCPLLGTFSVVVALVVTIAA